MTMKTDAKPALKMTPFSMNLGGVPKKSATVGPLKMSLPSQVSLCKIFCCTKNYVFLKSDIFSQPTLSLYTLSYLIIVFFY